VPNQPEVQMQTRRHFTIHLYIDGASRKADGMARALSPARGRADEPAAAHGVSFFQAGLRYPCSNMEFVDCTCTGSLLQ